MFKSLILLIMLQGCATPITSNDWYFCEHLCGSHLMEACRTVFDGLKCRCEYGGVIEVGEPPPEGDYYDFAYPP